MNFLRFVFSFLYVRNWHSGKMELSHQRLSVFFGGLFLILLALAIIGFLQAPVEYRAS
jgi:hypothetical protein